MAQDYKTIESKVPMEGSYSGDIGQENEYSYLKEKYDVTPYFIDESDRNETVVQGESVKEKTETESRNKFLWLDKNNYTTSLQRWKGYVTEVNKETFSAKLEDLTNKGTHEIASFDIAEVHPDDRSLIEKGAIFYWSIVYQMDRGQVIKGSKIRFQRIVNWSVKNYDAAADFATHIKESIKTE